MIYACTGQILDTYVCAYGVCIKTCALVIH